MNTKLESKRIWLFLLFAFGIAWMIDLVIFLTGGLHNLSIASEAGLLLVVSMYAPALAHVLTRLYTKESWQNLYLHPRFKQGKRFWLLAWIVTPLLLLLGMGLYFIILPGYFDSTFAAASKLLSQAAQTTGKTIPLTPTLFLIVQVIQAILIAPLVNSLATFGEEFGWRGYLLPKLMPLGGCKAMLLMGLIWGVWHWPVIFMGYEYGQSYPGYPWLGPIVFLWFTFIIGTFLAWLALKAKSIWPAVIAHAALNGIAPLEPLLVRGQPNLLLGPVAVGLLASLPFAVVAIWLLLRSDVFHQKDSVKQSALAIASQS
jgi:membrane protease YdiL (CAAX protease family)